LRSFDAYCYPPGRRRREEDPISQNDDGMPLRYAAMHLDVPRSSLAATIGTPTAAQPAPSGTLTAADDTDRHGITNAKPHTEATTQSNPTTAPFPRAIIASLVPRIVQQPEQPKHCRDYDLTRASRHVPVRRSTRRCSPADDSCA
jgi:hypothetical protein